MPNFLKGQLLLDGGKLRGSFFHRTVILVCEHNDEGAFGLILNRPSNNKIGEMLIAELPENMKEQPLFLGGPVQPGTLSFLHNDTFIPQANVIANLNLDHSLESLVEIGLSYSTTQQTKVFAGYAGWSPGQLETEMKRGSWLTYPASIDLIFSEDSKLLWKTVLKRKGSLFRLMAEAPEDLSQN